VRADFYRLEARRKACVYKPATKTRWGGGRVGHAVHALVRLVLQVFSAIWGGGRAIARPGNRGTVCARADKCPLVVSDHHFGGDSNTDRLVNNLTITFVPLDLV
jgi:hypothetical protein